MRPRRPAAALGAILIATLSLIAAPAGAAEPALLLPDLRVAMPEDLTVCAAPTAGPFTEQNCPPAKRNDRLLRFSSILLNVGKGPFQLHSTRPGTDVPEMTADQLIARADAGPDEVQPTDARVHWGLADDGHPHWHTEDVERYRLFRVGKRLPGATRVGAKRGYCFFDDQHRHPGLPGSPDQVYHFSSCGQIGDPASQDLLELSTGLSVGWADRYGWGYAGQWVDLGGLPDAVYLLCVTADPEGHFREVRKNNNEAWAKVRLISHGSGATYRLAMKVLARGTTNCQSQLPYRITQLPPPSAVGVSVAALAVADAPRPAGTPAGRLPVADRRAIGGVVEATSAGAPALLCTIGRGAA